MALSRAQPISPILWYLIQRTTSTHAWPRATRLRAAVSLILKPCVVTRINDLFAPLVFANIYYEFNNDLLDHVFSEKSNLKCALYGDIHTAAEKTNKGGQQSEAPPAGLTYIQHSSGYAAKTLADPASPPGYELVFGPTDGANNAPGVCVPEIDIRFLMLIISIVHGLCFH